MLVDPWLARSMWSGVRAAESSQGQMVAFGLQKYSSRSVRTFAQWAKHLLLPWRPNRDFAGRVFAVRIQGRL